MKETYIRIRISEKDKETVRKNSEKLQMSMSEYLVYLIRKDDIENKKGE